jgi:hypothetical protein
MWMILTIGAIGLAGAFLFGAWKVNRDYPDSSGSVIGSLVIACTFGFVAWALWFGDGPLPGALAGEQEQSDTVARDEVDVPPTTTWGTCSGLSAEECAVLREGVIEYYEDERVAERWDDYDR